MIYFVTMDKSVVKKQALATAVAVFTAVLLPQIFHRLGIFFGVESALGEYILPMHLPVFILGLVAGPVAGVIAGALSPLSSSVLSGMPAAPLLPFLMLELAAYGLVAGMLRNVKMPLLGKLLLAQIAGRVFKAGAILFAVYGLDNQTVHIPMIWNSVIIGLPGILLQWCLIPVLLRFHYGIAK
jgi:hypothetical protein